MTRQSENDELQRNSGITVGTLVGRACRDSGTEKNILVRIALSLSEI